MWRFGAAMSGKNKSADSLQLAYSKDADEGRLLPPEEAQNQKLDLEVRYLALLETLAELEDSRHCCAMLYDSAPVGCVVFGSSGRIDHINLTAATLLGVERAQLLGLPMYLFVAKSDFKLFLDHLRRCRQIDENVVSEMGLITKSGAIVQVQLISAPIKSAGGRLPSYVTMILDITERKQLEKELSRLDRLNTIGEMAASIAHEIRNPMTTVRGFLQLFRGRKEHARHEDYFNLMIDELDRANSIITDFLSLARNKDVKLDDQNLNAIIKSLYPMLQADALLTDKKVELDLRNIPNFPVDKQEMRQLILNLARNGLQAMSAGGNLLLTTSAHGNEVIMAVHDQGKGIKPDVQKKMGTPFFTTKVDGTGLGLAVCYSIAARHNAVIDLDTGAAGTTFFVRFMLPGESQGANVFTG